MAQPVEKGDTLSPFNRLTYREIVQQPSFHESHREHFSTHDMDDVLVASTYSIAKGVLSDCEYRGEVDGGSLYEKTLQWSGGQRGLFSFIVCNHYERILLVSLDLSESRWT